MKHSLWSDYGVAKGYLSTESIYVGGRQGSYSVEVAYNTTGGNPVSQQPSGACGTAGSFARARQVTWNSGDTFGGYSIQTLENVDPNVDPI